MGSHSFSDYIGWTTPDDVAYELEFVDELADLARQQRVIEQPVEPVTDIDKQIDIAIRWMERARFQGEPLVSLLYLFLALEALLGDKSEKLKGAALAFRTAMVSHLVTGDFTHPSETFFLYEEVRSGAVHGEDAPRIDDRIVQSFATTVRWTLDRYMRLAKDHRFMRRGALLDYVDNHPDRTKLIDWLRAGGGRKWTKFLDGLSGDGGQTVPLS